MTIIIALAIKTDIAIVIALTIETSMTRIIIKASFGIKPAN